MEMKVKPDSKWTYTYSTHSVYYAGWDIIITEFDEVQIVSSRQAYHPVVRRDGTIRPQVLYEKKPRIDRIVYISCYNPHEITSIVFWKWLEETCDNYYEYYNDLLSEFYERSNVVKVDDVDRDEYDDISRRHHNYIQFFKTIRNHARAKNDE